MNEEYVRLEDLERNRAIYINIYWSIKRFVNDIPYNIRKIKWFWQRGCRGYADCDIWDMCNYLAKIILPMLKQLKGTTHGYPCDLTEKKWDKLLDEMIVGFEAVKRVCDDEYVDKFQPDWFENNEKITKESMDKCAKEIKQDIKIFNKMMPIFTKYFFGLWD